MNRTLYRSDVVRRGESLNVIAQARVPNHRSEDEVLWFGGRALSLLLLGEVQAREVAEPQKLCVNRQRVRHVTTNTGESRQSVRPNDSAPSGPFLGDSRPNCRGMWRNIETEVHCCTRGGDWRKRFAGNCRTVAFITERSGRPCAALLMWCDVVAPSRWTPSRNKV